MDVLSVPDVVKKIVKLENGGPDDISEKALQAENMTLLTKTEEPSKEIVGSSQSIAFHLNTVWLFTRNDLKSIVAPETAFGIFSALSGPVLTNDSSPEFQLILRRIPVVILWCWINVLIFDVANQRLKTSVVEDSVNKPWRPLPSERLTRRQARRFLLLVVPLGFLATLYIGGMEETVAMMALTWMYNDLGGADESYLVRNLINACGFVCYSSGATRVACHCSLNDVAYQWLVIVGSIVFTTLQMQDMADQEGDKARNRGTLPLVHGDWAARWTIAIPVAFWSLACPLFWQLGRYGFLVPAIFGGLVSFRIILCRSVDSDKTTWKLWNLWISSLYLLPLVKYLMVMS